MNATLTITAYDMSVNGTAGATSQTSAAVTFGTFLKGDKGDKGDDGADGVTPHIGSNGNWYIGTTDTLVKARATDGADGVTPHIGDNGNWFFGTTDSGVNARGADGTPGAPGQPGNDGHTPTITATKQGTTTTILSDGVAIANIQDGQNGNDGNDADPLTIASQSTEADGVHITFSDGTSIIIPKGPKGDDGDAGTTDYDQLTNKPTIPTKTSDLTNDSGFLTSHQDISTKLSVKETLANGNIVLTDGNGNEKQYMAATPSGDPMHYAYVERGAEWNNETKYWSYGFLNNLTTKEVRNAYLQSAFTGNSVNYLGSMTTSRFLFPFTFTSGLGLSGSYVYYSCSAEQITISKNTGVMLTLDTYQFCNCSYLRFIQPNGYINTQGKTPQQSAFKGCINLEYVNLFRLIDSVKLKDSPKFRADCVAYAINNIYTTNLITITLHPTAYARAIADADVLTALRTKTNVTLTDDTNSINNPA